MLQRLINLFKKHKTLIIIALIAAILRFYRLDQLPPSLNWDEVSHGYNAFSILKTGKDEWGKMFPIIFRAYGDYKLPVYIYLTALFESLLGLNAFSVRLTSVLAGIGTVIFAYLLVGEFGKKLKIENKKLKIITALLVAIEPWPLFMSRIAFEANLALFFFTAGLYFFFKALNNPKFLIFNSLFFGLTIWTYNSYRVVTPLMTVILIVMNWQKLMKIYYQYKKIIINYLLLTTLFFLPMFLQLFSNQGLARYGWVSIINQGSVNEIINKRISSELPDLITRFIYNRPVYFTEHVLWNWTKHFSCSFLFFKGGSDYQLSVPGHGLIYFINLPFFFIGLILLISKAYKNNKTALFLLLWLIISPLPSSITREAPHVLRSITMLPLVIMITSIGFVAFYDLLGSYLKGNNIKKVIFFIYFGILSISLVKYLNVYFGTYKKDYSWSWQYGYKEISKYIDENYSRYDKIVITKKYGEPHEFMLFYLNWNPQEYQNDSNLNRFYQSNWYWVDSFDKFYFVNDWDIPKDMHGEIKLESGGNVDCISPGVLERIEVESYNKCVLITSEGNAPETWNKIEEIRFLDESIAFDIYEN